MILPEILCKQSNGFFREWLYKLLLKYGILPALDIVVAPPTGSEVILTLRKDDPARGFWWPFGGQIKREDLPGDGMFELEEGLNAAIQRITKRELGHEVDVVKVLKTYFTVFPQGPRPNLPIRYKNTAVLVRIPVTFGQIQLDETSLDCRIFSTKEILDSLDFNPFHPYVKKIISYCVPYLID